MSEELHEGWNEMTGSMSGVVGTSHQDGDWLMVRGDFKLMFSEDKWIAAKEEARQAMIAVARSKSVITYSSLVQKITNCTLEPNGDLLAHMLGEISSEEDKEGRGLLSAVVVHKTGDLKPGSGFFTLARSRGRHIADKDQYWSEELRRVHDTWST